MSQLNGSGGRIDTKSIDTSDTGPVSKVSIFFVRYRYFSILKRYSEKITITRDKNPLDWWKTREHIMSNLSKCAKKYLGIVATSVPSERLFSQAGLVVSDRRSCLKPENVEMMLFLNSYLKQK